MNEDGLAEAVFSARDVLRVETLPAYAVDSDRDWVAAYLRGEPKPDIETKRPWLNRISSAANRGVPWRRLRSVPDPVPDYIRYQAEWSYVDNDAAGEVIRIVGADEWPDEAFGVGSYGDFYVLDGVVVTMHYDTSGGFLSAHTETDPAWADALLGLAETAWAAYSAPFDEWWAARPDLHRTVTA